MTRIPVMFAAVLMLTQLPTFAEAAAEQSFLNAVKGIQAAITAQFKSPEGVAALTQRDEDTLIRLFDDPDPKVRQSAVKSFRRYVARRSDYRRRVLRILDRSNEVPAVKREALKTLSVVSNYSDVYRKLLNIARYGNDDGLRALAYKALYNTAASRSNVRDKLAYAARYESTKEVRLGAIWGLFTASNNSRTRGRLADLVRRDSDVDVRVEALKSLYWAMGDNRLRRQVVSLARSEDTSLRYTAILALSNPNARSRNEVERLLHTIARYDNDAEARRLAIVAMGNYKTDEIVRHFHLILRGNNGVPVNDPLEFE